MSKNIFSILLVAGSLSASPTGSIIGLVKDPSRAAVPGAKLTLTNLATKANLEAVANSDGGFQFVQLAPAEYSLLAEASGFKKFQATQVLVQVDQITHLDIPLEIGSISEVVEVAAVAPLLESDKSTLSHVVESRVISNMPLNARQFLDLVLLTPGVLPAAVGVQGGGFNVAGARSQSNLSLLDGVSNMAMDVNTPINTFRITDAVQEFAVQTSVATPEFGRGTGGQVNIVTKSGANQFHGSAFEYLRNSKMDAADFFTNKLGGTKNPLHRNQYGATLGGPIIRDKTFFFVSWEGFRQVAPTVSATRVPTNAERATVSDPISKALLEFWPAPNTVSPGSTINFIANVRASAFDNTGLVRLDHNLTQRDRLTVRWAEFQGALSAPGALPQNGGSANEPLSRLGGLTETHGFSSRLLNEFRFGYSRFKTAMSVQDNGFDASRVFAGPNGSPLPGVVNASQNPLDSGLPKIIVAGGFASLGSAPNQTQGSIANTYEIYDNVSLIAPIGASKHSWRWGYHVRREEFRFYLDIAARGTFNFSNFADFAAGRVNTATFLSGSTLGYWFRYPWDLYWQDTYKVKDNFTLDYGLRYEYPSAIRQKRDQATNFIPGVGPVLLGTNKVLAIDATKKGPASLFFTQAPFTLSNSGVNSDKNNFAPVVGFAYTPRFAQSVFGHDDTVIRGGFRVGYDEIFQALPAGMARNPPHNLTTSQTAGVTQPDKFPWALGFDQNVPFVSNLGKQGPGTPASGALGFGFSVDQNLRSAYLYQYNFGIQRRVGREFSLEVDYLGSTGHKLGIFVDQNQPVVIVRDPTKRGSQTPNEQIFPYPFFAKLTTAKDIGNSNYNGMVVTGKYQGHRGIFLQGGYTFGKSLDYDSAFNGSSGERSGAADAAHIFLDRGPSSFDIRHRAVFSYVIDLPAGPGHRILGWNNGLNRQVFGGWQISGITTFETGTPFTVFNTAQDFSGFNQFNDRPNVLGAGPLQQDNRNPDAAFNTKYFSATPPAGRIGTSGRNQYYGPGIANYDFAAAKNFPLSTERIHLQFRGDFFNLFNHTNFANPQNNQSNANFGKITQTVGSAVAALTGFGTAGGPFGGARVIQLSLRLQF
jgi:hypothetical protein